MHFIAISNVTCVDMDIFLFLHLLRGRDANGYGLKIPYTYEQRAAILVQEGFIHAHAAQEQIVI